MMSVAERANGHTLTAHTPGAIRAAEVITGGIYGETHKRYSTTYGEKTLEGIADIIDNLTAAPDLLQVCRELTTIVECVGHCVGTWTAGHQRLAQEVAGRARELIHQATGTDGAV